MSENILSLYNGQRLCSVELKKKYNYFRIFCFGVTAFIYMLYTVKIFLVFL